MCELSTLKRSVFGFQLSLFFAFLGGSLHRLSCNSQIFRLAALEVNMTVCQPKVI